MNLIQRFLFLAALIFLVSCSGFQSNLTIPPYQEFALGEFEPGSFEVDLTNQSKSDIKVQTRNKAGKTTSSFGLSGGGNTKVSIPCNLEIIQAGTDSMEFRYIYPEEPQANDTSLLLIRRQGKMLGDQEVVEVGEKDGLSYIKTLKEGEDDVYKVVMFYTYLFNGEALRMKKEYQKLGSDNLKFRNEYVFAK